jgi:hypothetical protein
MQANKWPGYEFPENEKAMYHIKLIHRTLTADKQINDIEHVAKMSPKDYQTFKAPERKSQLGYFEATILHDPMFIESKPAKQPDKEPAPEEPEIEQPKPKGGRPKK